MTKNKKIVNDQRFLLGIVIIAIIVIVAILNPRFIAINNLITIFQQISVNGILTLAIAILMISGGIDMSVGNMMVLIGLTMATVMNSTDNTLLGILAGIGVGMLCGLLNGVIIAKSKCIPLIITLGTSQIFYGIALTISGGSIVTFGGRLNGIGKTKIGGVVPVMLFVLLAMVLLSYFIMNKTLFGRKITAIGGNEKNAFLSGIKVTKYKILTYVICGFYCAIAAIIFCARIDSIMASAGSGYETTALTSAIIGGVTFDGGKGTIVGAFLGCVLLGVVNNAMNIMGIQTYIQTIITGIIIVTAVVLSNINNMHRN